MQPLTVAAISTRNLIGQPHAAIRDMAKWLELTATQGAELVLFPELNVSGYIPAPLASEIAETIPGPSSDAVVELARQYHTIIACGLIEKDAGRCYCTHLLVGGDGVIGKQRKIHVPAHEQPFWHAGGAIDVFDTGKAVIGMTICRDAFFDEMTRTLYFKGAEIVLMPFGYYNVPRSQYLKETIHGMSLVKACWANGYYAVVCNSAESRGPSEWEPDGRLFPGWAGVISPWGRVVAFAEDEGNGETCIIQKLDPAELDERRNHPNFLAKELRPELYKFQ